MPANMLTDLCCCKLPAIPKTYRKRIFGYEAGAFTVRKRKGKGLFELAIMVPFLDEIGDIPLSFQARLLMAIQEKEIVRIMAIRFFQ